MANRRKILIGIITTAVVLAALAANAVPQRGADTSDPVVREIRDLRFAVERAAAESAKVNLIVAQANAAQSRIASLSWELSDVRTQLARTSAEAAKNTEQMEQALRARESDLVAAIKREQVQWDQFISELRMIATAGR